MTNQSDFFRKRAADARRRVKGATTDTQKSKFEDSAAEYDALAEKSDSASTRRAAEPDLGEIKKQLAKRSRKAARPKDHRDEGGQG